MNSDTLCRGVNRCAGAECRASVVTARTKRGRDILRTIVNRIGINRSAYQRCVIRPGSDRLVVNTGWNASTLARQITKSVVVREQCDAVLTGQLRHARAIGGVHM